MAHVRVQRLGAGNAQEDPAKDEKSLASAGEEIPEPMTGIEREEDRRVSGNAPEPEQRDHREP